jgi:lipopolysaccharide/colanic/teichoic acid biosynthesis glycosyltransferase
LYNQSELIKARQSLDIYRVLPGITGLAQVSNIDMSEPQLLAMTDRKMLDNLTVRNYFKLILLTISGRGSGDAIN